MRAIGPHRWNQYTREKSVESKSRAAAISNASVDVPEDIATELVVVAIDVDDEE